MRIFFALKIELSKKVGEGVVGKPKFSSDLYGPTRNIRALLVSLVKATLVAQLILTQHRVKIRKVKEG